jgi:hypothetical protein
MLAAKLSRLRTVLAATALLVLLAVTTTTVHAAPLPGGGEVKSVDFERHIMGLFGRMGCASGSCHGSFQGKGGLRLSLFGYEPDKDYLALTRDVLSRRVDTVHPDSSLLLLKASGQVPHGGGMLFNKESWQYQVFREWIANGAPWKKGSGEVVSVQVTPPEVPFTRGGESVRLKVLARFADGAEEDITPFCDFRINDDAVADVTNLGVVSSRRPGDTAVVVAYRGQVLPVRVLVPYEAPAGFAYPKVPEVNFIDREVFAKLKRLNIVPSDLCSDAEFLRRVTIDTIGSLPSPDEVRAFLADKSPNKREKKIDELLSHPQHAALWATKFCDITGNNTDALENPQPLRPKRSQAWHDWFRKRVADNVPYDEIVRGVLCATSRDNLSVEEWIKQTSAIDDALQKGWTSPYAERASLDLYWRRQQNVPLEQWGEKTAAAFLGVRLECAQCHKHPFDRWTQADYRAYANIFAAVTVGVSPDAKKAVDELNAERKKAAGNNNNQINQVRELYVAAPRALLTHPDTNRPLPPKAPLGPEIKHEAGKDARVELFEWLRSPDNPFFARSFVNRIWGHYFGLGLVDPVDNFALGNPPSNEKLLDALAHEFIEHKYDIRHMEKVILLSRTYQLSSATNASNRLDRNNYSHAYIRPMLAEVVVDVLNTALGTTETWGNDAPAGVRAIEVGASRLNNQNVAYAFRIFGRSPRAAACDCERTMDPALPQKLFLMTDANLMSKFTAPGGRLQTLIKSTKTDEEALEELFLATVSRLPTEADRKVFAEHKARVKDRAALLTDTLWALINTREFILNH